MERKVSRREVLRESVMLSMVVPWLRLSPGDDKKIVLDIAGYNIPLQVRPDKEAMALREFRMLRGESAVVLNPSLNMVNEFRRMDKRLIVRPYFEHNNYDPKVLKNFLGYPPGITWLPFVEPNIIEDLSIRDEEGGECKPKVVGKVVHDPDEIINNHFVPFAQAVLARPGGDQDIILIPPTAQWSSENDFDYPEVMFHNVRKSNIPMTNLRIAAHNYQRRNHGDDDRQFPSWSRLATIVRMSTVAFGELLSIHVTEAGPYHEESSNFSEAEKAEVTEKTLAKKIEDPLLKKGILSYNLWNQGYYRYAYQVMKDPNGCHNRVVNWFEKAAIIKEDGATETFHRIRDLARRRDAELGRG